MSLSQDGVVDLMDDNSLITGYMIPTGQFLKPPLQTRLSLLGLKVQILLSHFQFSIQQQLGRSSHLFLDPEKCSGWDFKSAPPAQPTTLHVNTDIFKCINSTDCFHSHGQQLFEFFCDKRKCLYNKKFNCHGRPKLILMINYYNFLQLDSNLCSLPPQQ